MAFEMKISPRIAPIPSVPKKIMFSSERAWITSEYMPIKTKISDPLNPGIIIDPAAITPASPIKANSVVENPLDAEIRGSRLFVVGRNAIASTGRAPIMKKMDFLGVIVIFVWDLMMTGILPKINPIKQKYVGEG